jgi:hypothetical protein
MRSLPSIVTSILLCALVAGAAVAAPARGVSVMTACDASPERLDAGARELHGRIARRAATETLHRHGIGARRMGPVDRQLDVTVIRWRVVRAGGRADVTAEIRVVLCDGDGRMLSIANGKATASGLDGELAALREQAIAAGVGDLVARLGPQLAQTSA